MPSKASSTGRRSRSRSSVVSPCPTRKWHAPSKRGPSTRDRCLELLDGLDLLLTPTLACVAPPTGIGDLALRERLIANTLPFNTLGWPALALPVRAGRRRTPGLGATGRQTRSRRSRPAQARRRSPPLTARASLDSRDSRRTALPTTKEDHAGAPLLVAVCFGLLLLAPAAEAAKPVRGAAPANLHGFLLRADEPPRTSFARTPSFAWNPVPGAVRYQFQLATSSSFRESGIVYSTGGLTTPVAAPTVMLPWITGNPHALFARVRGDHGVRDDSLEQGVRLRHDAGPAAETASERAPGLLRWTPIEGADGYQVWFVDINNPTPKMETVFTNVLDEREFYTFHRTSSWTTHGALANPRAAHRPHRRQQADPPERPAGRRLRPVEPGVQLDQSRRIRAVRSSSAQTISDVVSTGDASSPAHRLMPAFTFSGDQAIDGTSAELFRIYVFTDRQCLNRVFTSAVIGGPAYAPRPFGPLALPAAAQRPPARRAPRTS